MSDDGVFGHSYCPMCGMHIDPSARICPYCRTKEPFQTQPYRQMTPEEWNEFKRNLPLLFLLAGGAGIIVVFLVYGAFFKDLFFSPQGQEMEFAQPTEEVNSGEAMRLDEYSNSGGLFHIVVASLTSENDAIKLAKKLEEQYPAEVYPTPNGLYAVTIGKYSRHEAKQLREGAIASGEISPDAWVGTGKKAGFEWGERVYPKTDEESVSNKQLDEVPANTVSADPVRLKVICSTYGAANEANRPNVLEVDISLVNQSSHPMKVSDNSFSLVDNSGNSFQQANTYNGNLPHLVYETLNPKVEKQYSLFFDIPGNNSYRLYFSNYFGKTNQNVALNPIDSYSCLSKSVNAINGTSKASKLKNSPQASSAPISPKKTSQTPPNLNNTVETKAAKEINFTPYLDEMNRRIRRNWHPLNSQETQPVIALFTITKDGTLHNPTIKASSGDPSVDSEAISAIERSAPFRPLPTSFAQNSITVEFRFDYKVFTGNEVYRR